MAYRRVFVGTFQGNRDLEFERSFFEETIVPAMRIRGALSTEMVQTDNNRFVATATYPDENTADANPDGIKALRKNIIETFNLDTMDAYGGTTVVGF